MIEFATEISEDSILNKKEAEPKKKKSIEDTIFEFFFILYYHHNCKEKSLVKQKLKLAIEATIWCLQMVSLLWIPNLLISDWEANMTMWVAIGYVKIDNTCSAFDIEDKCLYISMAYDFIVILGIFACFLAIYFSKSLPKIIISLLNRLIWLWLNFLCIPSLEIFTLFLKYSSQQKNVTEYKKNEDSAKYEISSPIQTLSIIAILICFLTILLYSILSSEIRHCAAKSTVNAKAHSKIEIHTAIFTFSFPVFYSIFADNYILHLQILALIISVFLIAETISFFPYFSEYCSIVVIIRFFIVALVSFLFIFGYCLDNSLSISIFAIILLPISIIFIIIYTLKLHKKLSKNIPESIDGIHDQYHLEKSLRYALCSENHKNKDEIIRIFENFFLFKGLHRCKLQIIWIANYCLFTLKNGALAKIKLSKAKSLSEWSLEARYQEYLCNRIITEFDSNESVSYENYYHKINQIKHQDRKLCENLSSFWEEVTSKNLSFYNLIRTLNSIDDGIEFLNAEYKQLTTKYHNSRDALIMYFLYMRNILHDYDNSDKINYKLRFFDRIFSSITNNTQNLSCFNSSNGILLISNEDENFGEILSANSKAMSFFNLSLHDIIGNNIQSFIPEPYKTKILDKMNHMVHFSSTTDTYFNDGCFFISKKNYLLETIGKASITSINSVLVTILVFKINRTQHQAALVSEEGEIYCYSEGFSEIAGNCNNLAGLNIKSLFPCLEKTELQPLTPYHIPGLKSETILIFMHSEFYSIKIPYVLLINDPNEIIKWKDENWRTQYDFSSENSVRPTPFSFQMLKSSVSEENSPLLSKEALGHDYLSDETTKIIKEKNNTEKSQSTESSSQCVFLQMIKISSRSIDVLHLILVLLVTFNQICVVIFTNLAVLFYAFNRINAVRDLSLPKALGDIGKSFQQIGLLSRLIFIFYPLSQAASIVNFCFSRFEENVKNLDNLYTNISGNLTNWGSCSGNDIFSENNINLWKIDDDIYKEKTNLIDTISQFIQFVNFT
ncbi:unnamed protein product [Blepharisma stoltei]|uniref:PAS domain-containing protein n=1 Tax=Blepharisma stoltei TaxID=1481888 RepID=A0AAU9JIM5_9CILI|nr:unnamed protein product [Blepharisma stoltei]